MGSLLNSVRSPKDLQQLTPEQLPQLCAEIREKIIQTVSTNGGHLASNLGVVELTVALHRVFHSPEDKIVWDVGHQAYTHKMLTGRLDRIGTIRTRGGLSGFPNRQESPHDPLTSGHSSTSISAALGIFKAKELKGDAGHVVAVIGDGALTGGLAYEGMNNAGRLHKNFIVILNDNKMSISRNVGSMARYLARIRTKPSYFRIKGNIENTLDHIPGVGRPFRHALTKSKSILKQLLYNSTIFEDMGFYYYGPFDGHDTEKLMEVFQNVKSIPHPVLIHVLTRKGKGYSYAEENPKAFHGVSCFNVETGKAVTAAGSFSSVFGSKLCSLASEDERICAITAAMQEGTGLSVFSQKYPERFFDTGIAEEHAVTFAGGLACGGMLPVFAVYSSFLQRGYDQLIHDVSLQRTKIVLAVDRAGIVGEDGETHQGIFDAAFLKTIPGITIYSPSYYDELQSSMRQALYDCDGLAAVRYPRGEQLFRPFDFHGSRKAYCLYGNESADIALITYGRLFSNACQALSLLKERGIEARIIKLNRIFPIDREAIREALKAKAVFFFEEGIAQGGIGEHFSFLLNQAAYQGRFYLRAINGFVPHETMMQALEQLGLSAGEMAELIVSECSD
ncbi:1-deoxy-D-xylulose-5-phosphate synthase [Caprobacter fermentans]|uniref:1-deoxy-D-xylulose-5-phosphate synthase n=1 Tax=Caproicibacter fermentans TaxID=2576756 RepID=A0A6N8I349_9FIRM|nr:1-deoxy-D-xylulose-5-phosphate synthase [Caproicibacter fermentans]MVB11943.1 1-deoxy-D-xylulose-5-phosphate synthase [Caproicibacter fermentans]OCM99828.1 1-deoxy-D-xylulose-5-phosphate synthase [Clostridium sp. W14A]